MITVKDITKIYGKGDAAVHALSECGLIFEQGKFTAIVGTSGSGKSTLLHLAAGLDRADSGEIRYDSTNILSLNDAELSRFRLKNIGVVFQFFNLIPELTARENILLPLMLDKTPVDTEYFEMLTEKLKISDRLSHYPSQLSGGQQQRTAIARALIHKPGILLCDEPTGNLDSRSGAEVLELLASLQKSLDLTVVMVTHDEKIAALADKIVRIEDGMICE